MIDVETAAPSLYVGRNVRILYNVKQEQKKCTILLSRKNIEACLVIMIFNEYITAKLRIAFNV